MYENERTIRFTETEDVKEFVLAAGTCDFDIDVYCNRAVIDGKSILGMLGFGLKHNLVVRYGGKNERLEKIIAKFAIA